VAVILRFYKLQEFITFLGDQGRDAIIIKRIITFEHLPAIGPPSSIGLIFLGPFYYYFVAPFLLLFNFNPLGLAVAVATLSLLSIVLFYCITKNLINRETSLISTALIVFSSVLIDAARFAWNPNLLPLFAFLTLYFFYKMVDKKSTRYSIACGAFLALSFQLHHLAGLLIIPMALVYIFQLLTNSKKLPYFLQVGTFIASFILISFPLILFDVKNHFLNSKNIIKLFTEKNIVANNSYFDRLLDTNVTFFNAVFKYHFTPYIAFAFLVLFIGIFVKNKFFRKNIFIQIHYLTFITYIIFFSLLSADHHEHYYNAIYYSFFLIIGYIVTRIRFFPIRIFLIAILFGFYILFNSKNYTFLFGEGNNQITIAKTVANTVLALHPQQPYQIVAIPYTEMDAHIRYFLEIAGKRPLPEDAIGNPKELYILCHLKECSALNDSQWQIAAFTDKKIATISAVYDIKVYKLIHGK